MTRHDAIAQIMKEAHRLARLAMSGAEDGVAYSACLAIGLKLAWESAKEPSTFGASILTTRPFGRGLRVTGYRSNSSRFSVSQIGRGEVVATATSRHSVSYELGEGTYKVREGANTIWISVPAKGAAVVIDEPASLWADKNAAAAAENEKRGLPALEGSLKQIAWAESIRARLLPRLGDEMEFMPETYYAWRSETSASAWIDMRNAPLRAFGE